MARHAHSRGHVPLQLAKPFVKAYTLGLLSSAGPRVVKVLLAASKGKMESSALLFKLVHIIREALSIRRFPAFCGVLVGGSTFLQLPIRLVLAKSIRSASIRASRTAIDRLSRFVASLLAAYVSFGLLNGSPMQSLPPSTVLETETPIAPSQVDPFTDPPESPPKDAAHVGTSNDPTPRQLAGKTMDLTLFALVRALDIAISSIWGRAKPLTGRTGNVVSQATPPFLFFFSAATIMHAWFYSPSRLPQTYNRWISAAAQLDRRLLLALRHARYGTFVYGKDTGMRPLLGSLARELGLPEALGDPAETVPVPCELVHMGCGKSCEKHALVRFWKGWLFAAKMYAPLHLLALMRKARSNKPAANRGSAFLKASVKASADMARSSSFLGAFIALFYYGVCLSRTRLGPRLFSRHTVTPQMWDSGLCVLGGCLLCGASILVEQQRKRLEILFFVLPRAAAAWFPRRYSSEHLWKEHLAFSLSTALVFTTAQEAPQKVRGVLGAVLHSVLQPN